MKFYKDSVNNVFAYEQDGSQDHLIDNKILITKEEADQLVALNKKTQFDALSYSEKRKIEYPSIFDYIDGIVKGDEAQVAKYIATCQAIKEKYPKPQ